MSEKQYEEICLQCGKPFIAKKKGAKFCSNIHKARYHRDQNEIVNNITPINDRNPEDEIHYLSENTGKDLSECKRPDGKHLYKEIDLWILMAKLNKLVFVENSTGLFSVMNTNHVAEQLILDFERRFQCKFSDAKIANSHIRPGRNNAENYDIVNKYGNLQYSR